MDVRTLKKNKEFNFVYRRGEPAGSRDMTLVAAKSRYGGIRVGFSVRNRVRRRMKEAYRTILPELSGNHSLVFVARASITSAEFSDICTQMRKLLERAGILSR